MKTVYDNWMQGLIEENKMDTFNIPQYNPSPKELKLEIEKEGSFAINRLEVSEVSWNIGADDNEFCPSDEFKDGGDYVARYMRAVAESLLVSHFGEGVVDEVFRRYSNIITDRMSKEKTRFINVVVSVRKIG